LTAELPSIIPASWDWKNPDYNLIARTRMKRLAALRANPSAWGALKDLYANDAIAFVSDWGWTYDPRNADQVTEDGEAKHTLVPFLLFPKQEEFLVWTYDRWVNREGGLCEKSRECGVSWLCVGFAVWMWQYRKGSVVGFGSRKEEYVDKIGDPKSLFWKARKFVQMLPVELRPVGYNEKQHAPFMRLINPETESTITGEAGNNIGRGNRTSIYFVDEAAFLEHPEDADAALSETTNCRIDVSSANGPGNSFHRKRMGGKVKVFTFHWRQDPRKDQAWYDKKCAELEASVVASEIDINYEASITNALIPFENILKAQMNGPANVSASGPKQLSVDVARYGNNESVITYRHGRLVPWQRCYRKTDTVDVVGHVVQAVNDLGGIDNVAQIAVDDIGVGGGVTDQLKRLYGKKVRAVNASTKVDDGKNWNLRARMYEQMLEWFKNEPVSIPNDPELKVQLSALKYRYRGGLRLMESKKDADSKDMVESTSKSPDRADSLALSFAYPCVEQPREMTSSTPEPHDRGAGY
jgi:phage terminase large subunit